MNEDNAGPAAGWYLTADQLKFLRTVPYHYNAWSMSALDRTVFQPWVAPTNHSSDCCSDEPNTGSGHAWSNSSQNAFQPSS
jgi:hypothetical protein